MPKLSVIIPLYNKEKDVLETLQSLLVQSFSDFEALVINDGSTDRSLEVVATLRDPRIRLFDKANEGVSLTRNYGAQQATTPYIVFLDADDYWYTHHLENIYQLIQQFPDCRWWATAYAKKFSSSYTQPMSTPVMQHPDQFTRVTNYFENSLQSTLAWTSAVAMEKEFFNDLGGFDSRITAGAGEDTDLWIRAALESPLGFCTQISAIHNLQGSNRLSHTPTRNRNFFNPDRYEKAAPTNPFLKKYLDLNRYSIALQHKLAGDVAGYKKFTRFLDTQNLNKKQVFLLIQPRWTLKLLYFTKYLLQKVGIHLSAFK